MGKLIPGAKLIYERVDETVYARYRDAPHNKIPRWEVGGSPKQMELFDHHDFNDMVKASKHYPTLKKSLDKLCTIWYTIKDEAEKKITAE
jgi:hypothetical protein